VNTAARRRNEIERQASPSTIQSVQRRHFRVNAVSLLRRRFLRAMAGAVVIPITSRIAQAQSYPSRPVRIIVPYAPGGTTDVLARLIGHWLSERFHQPFLIENRPGGGANIGTEAVVNAAPDGHTLLLVTPANANNATLYGKLNYDFLRDIVPVAGIARAPNIMEVNPAVPATTVGEFIAYSKANPGKISFGSAGTGTSQHLSGEMFKMMTGLELVHVPYRGEAPALTDLLGGQVQLMFLTMASSVEHVRSGRLRPLATTAATRVRELPNVAALAEFLPGFEASVWFGIGAPRNTPLDIIDRLNTVINESLADPSMRAQLADLGAIPMTATPVEFGKFVAQETGKWAEVIKFAGIKAQ
jgi:tripartite-type tricarboxylate transporter receptor subunit TctC